MLDEHISYIGDDINDIPLLKRVGLPAAVADAPDIVKNLPRLLRLSQVVAAQ